ncbi:MAG: adenosylcobinamide-phosphate synthase CbiB [Phycisphaerae bacterium]
MRLEYQIIAAFFLDLAIGDPRWMPHPVRGIGWLAVRAEGITRTIIPWPRFAGLVAALSVIGLTGCCAFAMVRLAGLAHPVAGDIVSVVVIYTTIAARDLADHSLAVFRALAKGDVPLAKERVRMIVGRDVDHLDESEIVRAAVESVAESTVDGVTAPLFFAVIAGPVGAMVYRAINTLDSMFGYKNERYLKFGWASARIDDLANLIPARLTAPIICLAAGLLRQRPILSLRILLRDARKHTSPNSGFPEAAMAGALGVRLGGVNYYFGRPVEKPAIGDPVVGLTKDHIPKANALMFASVSLFLLICLGARVWLLWRMGK